MKKLLAVAFAGSAILAASVWAATADGGSGSHANAGRGWNVARMQADLGLTDDQVAQLQKMKSDGRAQAIQRQANLRIAQGELEDLMKAPAVDEKAINAKVAQVTSLQAAATQARIARRLAVRRILTPDQLAKMEALQAQHGPRQHRGPHGPRPVDPGSDAGPGSNL